MTDQPTICKTINKQEMNEEQRNRIVATLLHDPSVRQSVQLRRMMMANDPNAIHTLAESIRQTPYIDLTDDMLSQIINEIQRQYGDVAAIRLGNWADEDVVNRLVELNEYVRGRLARMLDKQERNIGWSIVGKIINAVFGNVPVITKGVRKALHESGCLQSLFTTNIHTLLVSVREFWNRHRTDIIRIADDMIVAGARDLGLGLPPEMAAIDLGILLLGEIIHLIYKELRYNQHNNVEHRN